MKKTSGLLTVLLGILFSVQAFAAPDGVFFTASPPSHKSYLFEGEMVSSPNGLYVLTMQTDGNLVLYKELRQRSSLCSVEQQNLSRAGPILYGNAGRWQSGHL